MQVYQQISIGLDNYQTEKNIFVWMKSILFFSLSFLSDAKQSDYSVVLAFFFFFGVFFLQECTYCLLSQRPIMLEASKSGQR